MNFVFFIIILSLFKNILIFVLKGCNKEGGWERENYRYKFLFVKCEVDCIIVFLCVLFGWNLCIEINRLME